MHKIFTIGMEPHKEELIAKAIFPIGTVPHKEELGVSYPQTRDLRDAACWSWAARMARSAQEAEVSRVFC